MNLLEIIYMVGIGAVCLMIGLCIGFFLDAQSIRELQDENRVLRLEKQALEKKAKHEVIEIVDNRTANGNFKFGGF